MRATKARTERRGQPTRCSLLTTVCEEHVRSRCFITTFFLLLLRIRRAVKTKRLEPNNCYMSASRLLMRYLQEVHHVNSYRFGHVCFFVCPSVEPHDSTRERMDGFAQNLIRTLCHWGLHQSCTFHFPTIGNTNMANERVYMVRSTLAPLAKVIKRKG
jgi:hypothetical protein